MDNRLIGVVWVVVLTFSLSLSWLLPNHSPPWTSFHADAWAAAVLAATGLLVAIHAQQKVQKSVLLILSGVVTLIPIVQFQFGQIVSAGTAWISSLYLFGLFLAVQTGRQWEMDSPKQCADFLFTAVVLAGTASFGLQLYQLFGPDELGAWVMAVPGRTRLDANVAQPNQLATLQLLGVIGCSWGHFRGRLSAFFSICCACVLLFGVALTGSRTAWVNATLLLLLTLALIKKGGSLRHALVACGLWSYFVMCVLLLPTFYEVLATFIPLGSFETRTFGSDLRLKMWSLFLQATWEMPWWGYGWGQIPSANLSLADRAQTYIGLASSSHNLLLDLVLWNGYPTAFLIVAVVLWWAAGIFKRKAVFTVRHEIAFLIVLLVHAMLELPLQYAFFLLPFGLIVGTLDARSAGKQVTAIGRIFWISTVLVGVTMLGVTIRDYLRVEESYYGLRFEVRGFSSDPAKAVPSVAALTQFRDLMVLSRNKPQSGLNAQELQWMRNTVNTLPSAQTMYNLAANLALNGETLESQHWMKALCKTMAPVNCLQAQTQWESEQYPKQTEVAWPELP